MAPLKVVIVLAATVCTLAGCTYHRTVVERPASRATVVVPDRDEPPAVILPGNGTVVVPN